MPSNRAFTLLELLVVITIIGILSSIVIVSMSGSTDSATIAKGKAYAQQVHALLGSNAVGVWNFDEGADKTCSGGEDICDISGYGNHGIIIGDSEWISSDIEGYALSFDGDYISIENSSSLNITDSITLGAWVKLNSLPLVNYTPVINKGGGGSSGYRIRINSNGAFYTEIKNFGYYYDGGNTKLSVNIWYYIMTTYDNTSGKMVLYLDGVGKSPSSVSGKLKTTGSSLVIAGDSPSRVINGLIDEVRIYSAALPSTEIQKHYVQGLNKLLVNQAITKAEYERRMEKFDQSLVRYEE